MAQYVVKAEPNPDKAAPQDTKKTMFGKTTKSTAKTAKA